MNKALGVGLLVAGVVLIFLGIDASDSIGSDFSRFFNGSPSNKDIWLLIGGSVSLTAGWAMSMRPTR